jgi:ubiquinone/menaquinone biosynthesis C-methylase UbiE
VVAEQVKTNDTTKDYLWLHLRDLPYFRAMLRAVEAAFYQDIELPGPTLDLGCGDGHFASLTFEHPLDVGLDPWTGPIREARQYDIYHNLVQANGAQMPFPEAFFGSAVSNSVLEHIPNIDEVLQETSRVMKPGAVFAFCCPNHNFLPSLSIGRALDKLGLQRLAEHYREFFNRIARHQHCNSPETWQKRLERAGFHLEKHWNYFPPEAIRVFEWGHFLGLPSLIWRKVAGRWNLSRARWNFFWIEPIVRKYYTLEHDERGTMTFFIARRNS